MKLTRGIQEALLAILCYDSTPGGARTVAGMIPAKTYDPYYRDIAEAAVAFLQQHGQAPGEHTLDIFEVLKARAPDDAESFDRILFSLEETRKGVNRDYTLSRAKMFARHQNLKRGIAQAIDALEKGTEDSVMEAEASLAAATEQSYDLFDPGIDFFREPAKTLAFLSDEEQAFPTGIPELDRVGLGPARKQLFVPSGRSGTGKTWFGQEILKHNILVGHRCLAVTLEMSAKKYCQRILQNFFSITKRRAEVVFKKFLRNNDGRLDRLEDVLVRARPSFRDKGIHARLVKKLAQHERRRLIIKEFPTGRLTIPELEGYLDSLEGSIGFIPDLMLLDYPDLMSLDLRTQQLRIALGRVYQELRGLAVARNMAVVAPSQLNRESAKHRVATKENIAEDYSKVATADTLITYNQTPDELDLGLARLFVAKGREDADQFLILLSQAYAMGQFRMDSARMVGLSSEYLHDLLGGEEEKEGGEGE